MNLFESHIDKLKLTKVDLRGDYGHLTYRYHKTILGNILVTASWSRWYIPSGAKYTYTVENGEETVFSGFTTLAKLEEHFKQFIKTK
jgi:hypothetical protein